MSQSEPAAGGETREVLGSAPSTIPKQRQPAMIVPACTPAAGATREPELIMQTVPQYLRNGKDSELSAASSSSHQRCKNPLSAGSSSHQRWLPSQAF